MKTGKVVSARIQERWRNFATHGKPLGLDGEPEWLPYQEADRACLVIDREDSVVNDVDLHIRRKGAERTIKARCSASGSDAPAKLVAEVSSWTWQKHSRMCCRR